MADSPPDAYEREIDALYAGPPESFVRDRDALAARLRADGDRQAASAVKALRRPVASAWAANVLAREQAEAVADWLDLGARLRAAQEAGDGEGLRALARERSRLSGELVSLLGTVLAQHDVEPSSALLDGVRSTLDAALADPDAAEQVLSARLTAPLHYAGFGFAGAPPPRVAEGDASAGRRPGGAAKQGRASDRAQQRETARREDAERTLLAAEEAHAAVVAAGEEAESTTADLTTELEQARERLRDLERRLAEASLAVRAHASDRARAERELERARRKLHALE